MLKKMQKKFKKIKSFITSFIVETSLIMIGSIPVYAAGMPVIEVDGMDNVAKTLQNFVKYLGLFFIAAGVVTFAYGAYKLFQSIKAQDSESRSTAILEIAAGLGAIAVGSGCTAFSSYISL